MNNRRIGSGMTEMLSQLEKDLVEWVKERAETKRDGETGSSSGSGDFLTMKQIREEAKQRGINGFKASDTWVRHFITRHGLEDVVRG